MMPSRGLRAARGSVLRKQPLQTRNLSSIPRSRPQNALRTVLSSRPSLSASHISAVFSVYAVRNASTATASAPASSSTSTSTPLPGSDAAFPNLDTITLDNVDLSVDPSSVPERIGFLSELGFNYGWGPTSCLEWALEHVHVYSGLPWWASVAATAVAARLVLLPLFIRASDSMARANALASITKPVTDRMTVAQKSGDTEAVKREWAKLNTIRKNAGISLTRQFTPMILQGVIGYSSFKLLRAMAALPVPGLQDGGFLWLSDLTIPDGFLIMPAVMALSIHMVVRLGGETGASANNAMPPGMKNIMLYAMPGLIFLFTAWMPGIVSVWFAGTSTVGIVQTLLLQRPAVREFFGIAPLYVPTPAEAQAASPFAQYFGKSKDSGAKSKQTVVPASFFPASSASSSTPAPKGPVVMQWQAPNLRTQQSSLTGTTAHAAPATAHAEGIASNNTTSTQQPESKGAYTAVTDAVKRGIQGTRSFIQEKSDEQVKEAAKKAWQRRAEEYERNASKRRRR